jgi:hypothetical protein
MILQTGAWIIVIPHTSLASFSGKKQVKTENRQAYPTDAGIYFINSTLIN